MSDAITTFTLTLPPGSPWNGKLTEGTRVAIERAGIIYTDIIATIERDETGVDTIVTGGIPNDDTQPVGTMPTFGPFTPESEQ